MDGNPVPPAVTAICDMGAYQFQASDDHGSARPPDQFRHLLGQRGSFPPSRSLLPMPVTVCLVPPDNSTGRAIQYRGRQLFGRPAACARRELHGDRRFRPTAAVISNNTLTSPAMTQSLPLFRRFERNGDCRTGAGHLSHRFHRPEQRQHHSVRRRPGRRLGRCDG